MSNDKLTDEHIENWRRVLLLTLGPYALIMPKEQIQALRDRMQARADEQTDTPPDPAGGA